MNRYARHHKRDANDEPIIQALRVTGWTVFPMSATGFPDLLCVRRGRVVLVEVKTKKGVLKPAQEKLFPLLQAAGLELHVVRSPEEALSKVNGAANHIEALARHAVPGRTG